MSNPFDGLTRGAKTNAAAEAAAKEARTRLTAAWKRSLDSQIGPIFRDHEESFGRIEDSSVFPPDLKDPKSFAYRTKLEGGEHYEVEATSEATVNGENILGLDPQNTVIPGSCWLKFTIREKATNNTNRADYECTLNNSTGAVSINAAEARAIIANALA